MFPVSILCLPFCLSKIRFKDISRSAAAETGALLLQIKTPRAFDQ